MEGINQRRVLGSHSEQIGEQIAEIERETGHEFVPTIAKGFYALPGFLDRYFDPVKKYIEHRFSKSRVEYVEDVEFLLSEGRKTTQEDYRYLSKGVYISVFDQFKKAKIEWIRSLEFVKRLTFLEFTPEDIEEIQDIVIHKLNHVGIIVLPASQFDKLARAIHAITTLNGLDRLSIVDNRGKVNMQAFFSSDIAGMPGLKNQIVLKELKRKQVEEVTVMHELGHAGFRGVFDDESRGRSAKLAEILPKPKKDARDLEYIHTPVEVDARIQSMFNDLGKSFDPQKDEFGEAQLKLLKEERELDELNLNQDTKDLLDTYEDEDIIKLANKMPAI